MLLAPTPEEVEQAKFMLIASLKRMHGPEWDEEDEKLYRAEAVGCPPERVRAVALQIRREGGYRPSPGKIRDMLNPLVLPQKRRTATLLSIVKKK